MNCNSISLSSQAKHVLKELLQKLFKFKLMYFRFIQTGWPEAYITYFSYNTAENRFFYKALILVVRLSTFY